MFSVVFLLKLYSYWNYYSYSIYNNLFKTIQWNTTTIIFPILFVSNKIRALLLFSYFISAVKCIKTDFGVCTNHMCKNDGLCYPCETSDLNTLQLCSDEEKRRGFRSTFHTSETFQIYFPISKKYLALQVKSLSHVILKCTFFIQLRSIETGVCVHMVYCPHFVGKKQMHVIATNVRMEQNAPSIQTTNLIICKEIVLFIYAWMTKWFHNTKRLLLLTPRQKPSELIVLNEYFRCRCRLGFSGTFCEQQLSPCIMQGEKIDRRAGGDKLGKLASYDS